MTPKWNIPSVQSHNLSIKKLEQYTCHELTVNLLGFSQTLQFESDLCIEFDRATTSSRPDPHDPSSEVAQPS